MHGNSVHDFGRKVTVFGFDRGFTGAPELERTLTVFGFDWGFTGAPEVTSLYYSLMMVE